MRDAETLAREIADAVAELCGWQRGGPDSDRVAQTVRPLLAPLLEEQERLRKTRRDAHLALMPAGIRTHYLVGEDPAFPTGREVGLVERIKIAVERLLAAEAEAAKLREERDALIVDRDTAAEAAERESLLKNKSHIRCAALEAKVADLEAQLSRCGKENCMGLEVDGVASWVRKERLEETVRALEAEREGNGRCIDFFSRERDAFKAKVNELRRDLAAEREKSGRMERALREIADEDQELDPYGRSDAACMRAAARAALLPGGTDASR